MVSQFIAADDNRPLSDGEAGRQAHRAGQTSIRIEQRARLITHQSGFVKRKILNLTRDRLFGSGDGLDPSHGRLLVFSIKPRDLPRNPLPDRGRARVRHNEAQFAQTARPSPLPHRLHPFRRGRHTELHS
ncbi:MAG TPA: hypothetical protein VF007_05030 [Stellaceae bacterium]